MYRLQDGEQALHKEAAPRRVERDEEDVMKMKGCFSSGLMIDPFIHNPDALIVISTGEVLKHLILSQALFCEPYQTFFPGKSCIIKKMWPRTLPTVPRKAGSKCFRQEAH